MELLFHNLGYLYVAKVKKALQSIQIIYVNETISESSLQFLEKYTLAHNLDVPDALIAATALHHKVNLYMLNIKDFRYIQGLNIYQT